METTMAGTMGMTARPRRRSTRSARTHGARLAQRNKADGAAVDHERSRCQATSHACAGAGAGCTLLQAK